MLLLLADILFYFSMLNLFVGVLLGVVTLCGGWGVV